MQIKYYLVKTIDGNVMRITERKATKRDAWGRFTGNKLTGRCRWYGLCPFTTRGR